MNLLFTPPPFSEFHDRQRNRPVCVHQCTSFVPQIVDFHTPRTEMVQSWFDPQVLNNHLNKEKFNFI